MCGIAGFINTQPGRVNDGIVTRMTEAIAHRGPDEAGSIATPTRSSDTAA